MPMTRAQLFSELGFGPLWVLRSAGTIIEAQSEPIVRIPDQTAPPGAMPAPAAQVPAAPRPRAASKLVMPGARPVESAPDAAEVSPGATPGGLDEMDWDQLEAAIRNCERCELHRHRKQAIPGRGDRKAEWFFVTDVPGMDEDALGDPVAGPAGQLFSAMLGAVGLKRDEGVYVTNMVKCRTPGSRVAEAEEVRACLPYLQRQIALMAPRLILTLGRPAAQALLQREVKYGQARGKAYDFRGIPVVVSYAPASLLATPLNKAQAWEDLSFARDRIEDGRN